MVILFFLLLIAIVFSIVWYSLRYGISPMPTSPKVKKTLLNALPNSFEGVILDLGSGWGTLARAIAKKYPEAQVNGIEISWIPFLFSVLYNKLDPCKNLHFIRQDFFQYDCSKANLIVCYLYVGAMEKLGEKFANELEEGTLIISHTFALPGVVPFKVFYVNDLYHTPVYFYYW